MQKTNNETNHLFFSGPSGTLPIKSDDKAAIKLAMLIDGKCMGFGPLKSAERYGYTKQRFFQILHSYIKGGIEALKDKKKGPQRKYVRTETIENQIIRHRFLDPDASSKVIAQKLRQSGYNVSQRSVERTITEKGLQKKTSFIKSSKRGKTG